MGREIPRNLSLKIFSLMLALLLWILTTGENQKVKDLVVPLQFTGLPAGLEISGEAPDRITVRVQAPEPILRRITAEEVDARLDLSEVEAGDQYLTLSPDTIHVPGATVIRVDPEILPIRLVRQGEKEVPVIPRIEGRPPEGYEVVDYRVDPATVILVGPEDAVREPRRATTGSIPIGGLTAPHETVVRPVAEASNGSRIRLKDPDRTVRVSISIRERPIRRVIRGVPVRLLGIGGRARLKPPEVEIRIIGPASSVNSMHRGNLLAEVDLSGLLPRDREYRVTPRVRLVGIPPNRASEIEVVTSPRTIGVRIEPEFLGKP